MPGSKISYTLEKRKFCGFVMLLKLRSIPKEDYHGDGRKQGGGKGVGLRDRIVKMIFSLECGCILGVSEKRHFKGVFT